MQSKSTTIRRKFRHSILGNVLHGLGRVVLQSSNQLLEGPNLLAKTINMTDQIVAWRLNPLETKVVEHAIKEGDIVL